MSRLPECLSDPINFIKSSNQPWPLDFWLDTNLTIKNAPYIVSNIEYSLTKDETHFQIDGPNNTSFAAYDKFIGHLSGMSFFIRNRQVSEQNGELDLTSRDPNIYPFLLIQLALAAKNIESSRLFDVLKAYWTNLPLMDTNWNQFNEKLPKHRPNDEDLKKAARQTWTGKRFIRLGYNHPEIIYYDPQTRVDVLFHHSFR